MGNTECEVSAGRWVCKPEAQGAAVCPSSVQCGATASGRRRRRQWLGPAERLRALREGQGGPRGAEETRDVSSQILQGTEGLGQGRWQLDPTQLPDFPLTSLEVLRE